MTRSQRIRDGLREIPADLRAGWRLLAPRQRGRALGGGFLFMAGLALSAALSSLDLPAAALLVTLAAVAGAVVAAHLLLRAQMLGAHVPPSPEVRDHTRRQNQEPQ
jgi:hypothetical protein